MKNKTDLTGKYFIYSVFDTVGKRFVDLYYSTTDESFIRMYLPSIITQFSLRDIEVIKVGIFNDITGEITKIPHKKIKLDCYMFAHSALSPKGEDLPLDVIEKEIQETKNKILAERSIESKKSETENTDQEIEKYKKLKQQDLPFNEEKTESEDSEKNINKE